MSNACRRIREIEDDEVPSLESIGGALIVERSTERSRTTNRSTKERASLRLETVNVVHLSLKGQSENRAERIADTTGGEHQLICRIEVPDIHSIASHSESSNRISDLFL